MGDPLKRRRRWRRALRIGLPIVVLYTVAMSCGRPADRLLLIPQKSAERVLDASTRSVPFEGGSLEVFVARSPGAQTREPVAFMLEFTGNATRADDIAGWVASRWGDRPVEAWVMNYPGYGRSTGPARLNRLAPAGLTVYDELKTVAAGRPIFVAGNSMGTTVAIHVATKRPVAGLILQSPPPIRQSVLRDHGWWNLWLLAGPVALGVPSSLDSITQAALVHAPAVFITCDRDTLIKPDLQQRIIDAFAGPKRTIVLVNKGHNDSLDKRDELQQFTDALDWMMSQIPAASSAASASSESASSGSPPSAAKQQ